MTTSTATLGEIAEFVNGAAFSESDWSDSGMKIIRIQNLTDPTKPFNKTSRPMKDAIVVRPGDLLVSWSATLGVFEWRESENALLNQHIFRVIPDLQRVDKDYLRHVLSVAVSDMGHRTHGATMKHINRAEFLGTQVPLPRLEEQRRIASILDVAYALRTKRRQTLEKLDDLAQSIFIEMFGDPVKDGQEWDLFTLSELTNGIFDCPHSTPKWTSQGKICVRTSNLGRGNWIWEDKRFVSEATFLERSRRGRLEAGDIVLSREGTVGIAAIVPDDLEMCMGQRLVQVKPNFKLALPQFLLDVLLFILEPKRINHFMAGSTSKHINVKELRNLPIPLPPMQLQKTYVAYMEKIEMFRLSMLQAQGSFEALLGSLQHQAFRGEL